MTVHIASDHAGLQLKNALISFLQQRNYSVNDHGPTTYNETDDYPDYIIPAAEQVALEEAAYGIVIGGSGQGEAIAANKVPGIRAIVFYGTQPLQTSLDAAGRASGDSYELIRLSRQHNDANVLSLGARFLSQEKAQQAVMLWLTTPFSKETKHQRRLDKIHAYTQKHIS